MFKPKFLFLILILIIIFEAGLLFKNELALSFGNNIPNLNSLTAINPQTYTVNLTEEGFSPSEITINKGDTIVFTTTRNKPFWPASNIHPTHGIYPQFDPKQPIEADKDWSFTFDKVGSWKYHDHLAPLYKGVIVVNEKRSQANDCSKVTGSQKVACFENLMDTTLKNQGLSQTFETLATLYQTDPDFASNCHDFAHKLGYKAYELFSQHKDFNLSSKSSYCGYGFYHGFMESLLQTTGDMNEARSFCEYADSKLAKTTSDAGGACYHGIGHGAVDGSDPRFWGDAEKMVQPALTLCEKVSNDENPPPRYGKLFRCSSGAFNGLEILVDASKYNLSPNKEDPFGSCRIQPNKYKEACYTQFVVSAMQVTKGDFTKTANIISTIPEDNYAIPTMQSLVVERARGNFEYSQNLDFCRGLADRFKLPCVTSLAEGLMKYGPPQKEYEGAIKFCRFNLLNEEERIECFQRVLSLLRIWYTADKSEQICQSVDKKYWWNSCQYN